MNESYHVAAGRGIAQTSRNIFRRLQTELKSYDITPEQWTILIKLSEQDGLTQKDLSVATEKDQATLTRILDILQRKNLVIRRPNEKDRRSFLIDLTNEGSLLCEHLYPVIESIYREDLLQGIEEEEYQTFLKVLQKINDNAQQQEG